MPAPSSPVPKTGCEPRYFAANRKRYGTDRATPEIWAEVTATYYGMISRLDDQFGRVMAKQDELDLFFKTVTMFFTDHGEYLGDHWMIEKWPSGVSEVLMHEPLIIGGAGLPQGVTQDPMAEMVDPVPTVFPFCGIDERFLHDGKSLIPTLLHGKEHRHSAVCFLRRWFPVVKKLLLEQALFPYDIKARLQREDTSLVGKAISVRSKEWTYIYRLCEPAELYSRLSDPQELHNLASEREHQKQVELMKSETFRWSGEGSDFLPSQEDDRFPKVELENPREQFEKRLQSRTRGCE